MKDEEIEAIAEPFAEWLGDKHGCIEYGVPFDSVVSFARAIEAKVRKEPEPKFQVGDKVRHRDGDDISTVVEVESAHIYGLEFESGYRSGCIYRERALILRED